MVSFDPLDSRWPLDLSYPFFLNNAVTYLGANESGIEAGIRGEELLSVEALPGVKEFRITRPDGEEVIVEADSRGPDRVKVEMRPVNRILNYASLDGLIEKAWVLPPLPNGSQVTSRFPLARVCSK